MIAEDPVVSALAGLTGRQLKIEAIKDALLAVEGIDKMTVEFVGNGAGNGDLKVSYALPTGKTRVITVGGKPESLMPAGKLN